MDLSPDDLFQWAQDRFDEEEYERAAQAFLAYVLQEPLSPLVDSAQFLGAEGQLRSGNALGAIEEFGRIATDRPDSPMADRAQLGLCRAYLEASPRVSLSQEFTRRAIEECERLMQFFPTTSLQPQADSLVAVARAKLSEKNYEIGRYYQDRRKLPESAIVYYEIALSEGPGADFLPDLLWRLHETYREVGYATEADVVRERLLTEFPDSEEAARLTQPDRAPEPEEAPQDTTGIGTAQDTTGFGASNGERRVGGARGVLDDGASGRGELAAGERRADGDGWAGDPEGSG